MLRLLQYSTGGEIPNQSGKTLKFGTDDKPKISLRSFKIQLFPSIEWALFCKGDPFVQAKCPAGKLHLIPGALDTGPYGAMN